MTAAIAMYEANWLNAKSDGTPTLARRTNNPFSQTVTKTQIADKNFRDAHLIVGSVVGADKQPHAIYRSIEEAMWDHLQRWSDVYVPGDANATIKNFIDRGYNTASSKWGPDVKSILQKRKIDC